VTAAFFVAQVVVLAAVLIWMARRAAGPRAGQTAAIVLVLWLALTGSLAGMGLLAFGTLPPPVMVLVTVSTALTTWLGFSRFGTKLVERLPVTVLVGYQAFRVFVEIFLWLGYRDGFVPVQMTFEGRNFDVFSGLLALVMAGLAAQGRLRASAILAWNLGGLLLLINIVLVAILSMPTPFRQFHNEPANVFVTTAPYVWLPAFLVQAAWLGHLLVFRWLTRMRA
jgi:hypothetical protein